MQPIIDTQEEIRAAAENRKIFGCIMAWHVVPCISCETLILRMHLVKNGPYPQMEDAQLDSTVSFPNLRGPQKSPSLWVIMPSHGAHLSGYKIDAELIGFSVSRFSRFLGFSVSRFLGFSDSRILGFSGFSGNSWVILG